jgi:TonB family protein
MRVLLAIVLSLLIHLFLVWSAKFAPLIVSRLEGQKPIEVEIIDNKEPPQNETKNRQVVTEAPAPKEDLTEDYEDTQAYLSAMRQRVKKQYQAAVSGATANRSAAPSEKEDQSPRQSTPANKTPQPKSQTHFGKNGTLDAFTPKYRTMPQQAQNSSHMARGLSTVGEALPKDIDIGSFTALNTDQYTFYTFFARINEMIRFRWEESVRQSIDQTPSDHMLYNPSGVWTTHLEIHLNSKGEVQSTHLLKSSGFRGFDQAAIQAFVEARVFHNPPTEMIDSDGLIRLQYAFQVRYEPKVLVKSRE